MLSSCDNVREALLLARHLEIGLGDADTLYVHVYNWPGDTPAEEWLSFYQPPSVVAIGGLKGKVKSARLLKTGAAVKFEQDEISKRFTGFPKAAPDSPVTVIEVDCKSEPTVDHQSIRPQWRRYDVGIR